MYEQPDPARLTYAGLFADDTDAVVDPAGGAVIRGSGHDCTA
ncbi:hypothetical protein ACWFR5_35300 [Streptomyces sp. NPDC055092]